ncbi:MAG TPA: PIN domain-containing protein [Capsulimonadaceae bacterium]|jgi:predicted nucleic acid-binding protein
MIYLVDTNVVLRAVNTQDAQHNVCVSATSELFRRGAILSISTQVVAEFWNVITRPSDARPPGSYGFDTMEAEKHLIRAERMFEVLPDPAGLYECWRDIVLQHKVVGTQVHDARLAAWAMAYNADGILTLNGKDFARFPQVTVVNPNDVV